MVKVIYMKYLEKISNAPIALKLVIGAVPVLIIAMCKLPLIATT